MSGGQPLGAVGNSARMVAIAGREQEVQVSTSTWNRAQRVKKEGDPVRSGVPLPRYFGCIRLPPTSRTDRHPPR